MIQTIPELFFCTDRRDNMEFSYMYQKCRELMRNIGEQEWRSGGSARFAVFHGFVSRTRRHMWAEFVFGSLLCSERFFSGYSGFPLSSKTNLFKFQFDPGMHGHFSRSSCELLCASWINKFYIYILHIYFYKCCQ